MKLTDVDKYVALREALVNEKTALESRLAAINRALQGSSGIAAPKGGSKPGPKPIVRRGKRAKNKLTMKEAAVQALVAKPLDREALLKAVQKIGYKFTAKEPLNSLSTLLYTDKAFKNTGGKFSVGK
jgi:hypothetical protein